jgi:hypothetical protein
MTRRNLGAAIAALLVLGTMLALVASSVPRHRVAVAAGASIQTRGRSMPQTIGGKATYTGQVPLTVSRGAAAYVGHHPATADIGLNFGFPIRDQAALDGLIKQESTTHRYLTRKQLYDQVSPSRRDVLDLQTWLTSHGFRVTHVGADRMAITAHASTQTIENVLHVKINDYIRPEFTFRGLKVQPFQFYSNTLPRCRRASACRASPA